MAETKTPTKRVRKPTTKPAVAEKAAEQVEQAPEQPTPPEVPPAPPETPSEQPEQAQSASLPEPEPAPVAASAPAIDPGEFDYNTMYRRGEEDYDAGVNNKHLYTGVAKDAYLNGRNGRESTRRAFPNGRDTGQADMSITDLAEAGRLK